MRLRSGRASRFSCSSLVDRKSTRLNSSHDQISYAVFCLKKKNIGDAGIRSDIQGSNVPTRDEAVPSFVSDAMAHAGKGIVEVTGQARTSAVSHTLLDSVGLGGISAGHKGKYTREYLAAAFPELNAWERAGADASAAGMVDPRFENQKELPKIQLDNQKESAER